jgi:hypothetical protein
VSLDNQFLTDFQFFTDVACYLPDLLDKYLTKCFAFALPCPTPGVSSARLMHIGLWRFLTIRSTIRHDW